jgi:hypothetical protein
VNRGEDATVAVSWEDDHILAKVKSDWHQHFASFRGVNEM